MPLQALLIAPDPSPYAEILRDSLRENGFSISSEIERQITADLLILLIHADRGLSQQEIDAFNRLREFQLPSLILVTSLISPDGDVSDDRWDFDDLVMLINRTLEKVVTPYLVLHDDHGSPVGLYYLEQAKVIDYGATEPELSPADTELIDVVADFTTEFKEEDFTINDFLSGLRVVAIPYIPERKIGSVELQSYITMLQQAQL